MDGLMEQTFGNLKERIPRLSKVTYLDSAGAGLPPTSVTDAMKGFVEDWSKHGEHWDRWLLDVVELRREFGQLIGGSRDEVGVVPSVSVGLAALASSFDFSKRKKVVASSLNFPTNVMLWQRMRESGILSEVQVLGHSGGMVPLESWERAIDDTTAVVSVDYVSWFSGYRERVREIAEAAHKHGAFVVVDAFHAAGVFPFDVKKDGIDALVCGFYKWLCGPHGTACIYVDSKRLEGLEPAYIGWHGIKDNVVDRVVQGRDPFDVPFPLDKAVPSSSASRFEWGTWAMVAVEGAIEATRFAIETGPANRFDVIQRRRRELFEGLRDMRAKILTPGEDLNQGGGIVTYEAKDHKALVDKLLAKGIVVSGRYDHVRVAPHFYNTSEDTSQFLTAAKSI
jgi:selenocysteine lyase/cysteine desulfurase